MNETVRKALTLKQRLEYDLIEKSLASSIGFLAAALVIYLVDWHIPTYALELKSLALIIMGLIASRYLVSRLALPLPQYPYRHLAVVKALIFVNAAVWAIAISLILFERRFQGAESIMALIIMISLTTSSVITLSVSPFLATFFQAAQVLSASGVAYYLSLSGELGGMRVTAYALPFLFVYQMKQSRDVRKQMIEKLNYEFSLEKSNHDLKLSQERVLEETAKAQHASRLASLGEMAGGVAHEINNPLAAIMMAAENIEDLSGSANPILDQSRKLIQNSAERIAKIVKGLRIFSQQSDREPKQPVYISEIVKDTLDFCAQKIEHHNVEIFLGPIPHVEVLCGSTQISQVLFNLINNSYDAVLRHSNGPPRIEVTGHLTNANVVISVVDSGPGLDEKVRDKLFQPFLTTKDVGQGTGLGLSVAKGIMKDHKGDLVFDSQSPQTKFDIILPLFAQSKAA